MGSQTDSSGASGIEPNLGLLGRKIGMMRIFSDDGESIPVTVIDVSNNRVSQVKTAAADGYTAVQLVHGERRATRVTKAQAGHFAKAGVQAGTSVSEFHVSPSKADELKAGTALGADVFVVGQYIDVQGVSQGKGFTGTIKRHNFRSNRASHGNSRSHNVPGSKGGDVVVTPSVKMRLKPIKAAPAPKAEDAKAAKAGAKPAAKPAGGKK